MSPNSWYSLLIIALLITLLNTAVLLHPAHSPYAKNYLFYKPNMKGKSSVKKKGSGHHGNHRLFGRSSESVDQQGTVEYTVSKPRDGSARDG